MVQQWAPQSVCSRRCLALPKRSTELSSKSRLTRRQRVLSKVLPRRVLQRAPLSTEPRTCSNSSDARVHWRVKINVCWCCANDCDGTGFRLHLLFKLSS